MRTMIKRTVTKGFTLIEMLLVMVIISIIIYMGTTYMQQKSLSMRLDRTALQMQQILNAGLAYYVMNGSWPPGTGTQPLRCLQGDTSVSSTCSNRYIPSNIVNPWGQAYTVVSTTGNVYVYTPIVTSSAGQSRNYATIVMGKIPLGYTANATGSPPTQATCTGTTCYVVGSVNIPGQNLNNATAVNFANLYHHGACVPVPTCPVDANGNSMTPQIMVVPVSVSGVNDAGSTNVYPISSFTAYATGGSGTTVTTVPKCDSDTVWSGATTCYSSPGVVASAGSYWRVCLQVVTERGDVGTTNTATGTSAWGQYATLLAITRCAITNAPTGSGFDIYTK